MFEKSRNILTTNFAVVNKSVIQHELSEYFSNYLENMGLTSSPTLPFASSTCFFYIGNIDHKKITESKTFWRL